MMHGSPTDGLPWWAKALIYPILAAFTAFDKAREKLRPKSQRAHGCKLGHFYTNCPIYNESETGCGDCPQLVE